MNGIPPIYIITIRELAYRRPKTAAQFAKMGLEPIWIEGLNATQLGLRASVPHELCRDNTAIYIHPKVLSIGINHYLTLMRALDSGADEFFIMEDDVVLDGEFPNKWKAIRPSVPDEIQVIQCATTGGEDKPTEELNAALYHCYYPFCATCNWWRREGAQFAYDRFAPINSPADVIFSGRIFPFIGHAVTVERIACDRTSMDLGLRWQSSYVEKEER